MIADISHNNQQAEEEGAEEGKIQRFETETSGFVVSNLKILEIEIITADKTNGIAGNAMIWTIVTPASFKADAAESGTNLPKTIEKGRI